MRNMIVFQAKKWLGCNEKNGTHKPIIDLYNTQKPLPRNYKVKYTDEWCATFVSAVVIACDATAYVGTECSCTKMIEDAKKKGTWVENDAYIPSPGDFILYDWQDKSGTKDNTGTVEHIGIVEYVQNGVITVIEGNKGEAVSRRQVAVNGKYIRGFIAPNYPVDIEQMAKDVIAGLYGVGAERKKALGKNYAAVQKRVNELVAEAKIEKVAKEVIAGKWGNGLTRKIKLAAAGYNVNKVQAKVNELLKG